MDIFQIQSDSIMYKRSERQKEVQTTKSLADEAAVIAVSMKTKTKPNRL